MLLAVAALMSSSPACSSVMASPFGPSALPPPRNARWPTFRGPPARAAPSHHAAAAAAAAQGSSSAASGAAAPSVARRVRIAARDARAPAGCWHHIPHPKHAVARPRPRRVTKCPTQARW